MAGPDRGSPYGGPVRVARGWSVGAFATCLSVGGHSLAGGTAPSPALLSAIVGAASAVAVAMSSLEWTVRRLTGVLLVAQAGFHLLFMMGSKSHATGNPSAMLVWHVAASVVSVVVLRYAESALVGLVDRVGLRRFSTLSSYRATSGPRRRPPGFFVFVGASASWQQTTVLVRGPPAKP